MKRMMVLTALLLVAIALMGQDATELKALADIKEMDIALAGKGDYAAASKAQYEYGNYLFKNNIPGWKKEAKEYAIRGMKYGEAAYKSNHERVEGWYWYAMNVSLYSDCVSILSAIAEGLQGKIQKALENAYRIDKRYEEGGPIVAIGRYWQLIPKIAGRNLDKAEAFYNEYMKLYQNNNPRHEVWLYRGQVYQEKGRKEEARKDYEVAAKMGNKDAQLLLLIS